LTQARRILMRALNFAEVRAAGLPARVRFPYVTYEYRPLGDDVAVRLTPARKTHARAPSRVCTTSHMPETGWLHKDGCCCRYCR